MMDNPEWTDRDQKDLDYLTRVNQNTGINFNSDQLAELIEKKEKWEKCIADTKHLLSLREKYANKTINSPFDEKHQEIGKDTLRILGLLHFS